MKKLIQIIKSIKLKQILTVFLAGSLLVISTACSNDGNAAQSGGKAYTDTAKRSMSDTYDKYDANQPFEGGMNSYNDDPRYDAGTAGKTKGLLDKAKAERAKNLEADSIGDYVENASDRVGKSVQSAKRDIPRAINDRKEDIAEDVQRRTDTLKKNIKNVPDEAQRIVGGVKDDLPGDA